MATKQKKEIFVTIKGRKVKLCTLWKGGKCGTFTGINGKRTCLGDTTVLCSNSKEAVKKLKIIKKWG